MSAELITEGLGWKWFPDEQTLAIITEVDVAEDELGNPAPAGALIRLIGINKMPPQEKIRDMVDRFASAGIDLPGLGVTPCRVLTWADYVARGYNDEEGGAK